MPRLTTPVQQQPLDDKRCIAYAVAAGIETWICRDLGTTIGVPEISVDDLFEIGGREVGAIDGIKSAVENGGVVDTSCFPPGGAGRCAAPAPHLWKAQLRVIGGQPSKRVDLMRTELRTSGPLVTMIQVFSNFAAFTGAGIYQPDKKKAGFHAVCIIGDEVDPAGGGSWIVKNSMGTGWGDGGFGKIRWDDPLVKPEKLVVVVEKVRQ